MYMHFQSIIFDGEEYWDCLELPCLLGSLVEDDISSVGSSGYASSDQDDSVDSQLQDLAFDALGETPAVRRNALLEFRAWLTAQTRLRAMFAPGAGIRLDIPNHETDNFLLRFLRFHKFDVPKASNMLRKFLEMRCANPNWFMGLDPVNHQSLRELVQSGYVFVLPERDPDGRRVIFNYAQKLDTSRHTSADVMKTFISTFETLLADPENQIRGLSYIFYCKGLTLSHCQIWSPSDAAVMFSSCEKNLPLRHKSINLVNLPFGIWAVFEFCKSFLSSKIKSRISTISDEKKLANKVGKDILPLELGGKVPLAEMTSQWLNELCENKEWLEKIDSMVVLNEPQTPSVFKTPSRLSPSKSSNTRAFVF